MGERNFGYSNSFQSSAITGLAQMIFHVKIEMSSMVCRFSTLSFKAEVNPGVSNVLLSSKTVCSGSVYWFSIFVCPSCNSAVAFVGLVLTSGSTKCF